MFSCNASASSAEHVIRDLFTRHQTTEACMNINFQVALNADKPQFTFAHQGKGHLNGINVSAMEDPRSLDYCWLSLSRHHEEDVVGSESFVLRKGGNDYTNGI